LDVCADVYKRLFTIQTASSTINEV
jgi:hypothetical protein